MLFRRGLHLLLLLFTNCWLSLTSHTISVLQCWTVSCTCIRYAIGAVAGTERVWLVRLTCISDKSEKVTSWQDISFEKNVWNGSEDAKATKQSKKNSLLGKTKPEQPSISCCAKSCWRLPPWLWAHSRGTSLWECHRFVSTKDHCSCRDN